MAILELHDSPRPLALAQSLLHRAQTATAAGRPASALADIESALQLAEGEVGSPILADLLRTACEVRLQATPTSASQSCENALELSLEVEADLDRALMGCASARLVSGDVTGAASLIDRVVGEAPMPQARLLELGPAVRLIEQLVAAGEHERARSLAERALSQYVPPHDEPQSLRRYVGALVQRINDSTGSRAAGRSPDRG